MKIRQRARVPTQRLRNQAWYDGTVFNSVAAVPRRFRSASIRTFACRREPSWRRSCSSRIWGKSVWLGNSASPVHKHRPQNKIPEHYGSDGWHVFPPWFNHWLKVPRKNAGEGYRKLP
jgi:hypothetical protein